MLSVSVDTDIDGRVVSTGETDAKCSWKRVPEVDVEDRSDLACFRFRLLEVVPVSVTE